MSGKKSKIVRNYINNRGKAPFLEWLKNINDPTTRARIRRKIDRLEQGHYGDFKVLGDGICELRLAFGAGYRIYFAEQDDIIIILLCGGDKSSQVKDIKNAKLYWNELKRKCNE